MISIKDIAKQAGTSFATVSRVINNREHLNPRKSEQILKIIQDTGYVLNVAARLMVLHRSFTVGIIMPDTFNLF